MRALWLGVLAMLAVTAKAEPKTIRYGIPAALSYKDGRFDCEAKTMVGNEVFLEAKYEDTKLVAAALKIGPESLPLREFPFDAAELAAQKIEKDSEGRPWFSELVLSERLVREAFHFWTWLACGGVPRVSTVESAPLKFVFTVFAPKPYEAIKSAEVSFGGTAGDGRRYSATLAIGESTRPPLPR